MRLTLIMATATMALLLVSPVLVNAATTGTSPRIDTLPQLPREFVDTTIVPSPGRTLLVRSDGDFQEALDEAQPGDEIVLAAGAVYRGPFILPYKKSGQGWITIRSNAVGREF